MTIYTLHNRLFADFLTQGISFQISIAMISTERSIGRFSMKPQIMTFQVNIAMICKERSIGWFSTKPQIMTLFT